MAQPASVRNLSLFGQHEEVDLEALTGTPLAVLGDASGLPNGDFDIRWEFVAA